MFKKVEKAIVGLDICKSEIYATLLVEGKIKAGQFKDDKEGLFEFREWIKTNAPDKAIYVCIEHQGRYQFHLAQILYGFGFKVVLVHPFALRMFVEQMKTMDDITDSKFLAYYHIYGVKQEKYS